MVCLMWSSQLPIKVSIRDHCSGDHVLILVCPCMSSPIPHMHNMILCPYIQSPLPYTHKKKQVRKTIIISHSLEYCFNTLTLLCSISFRKGSCEINNVGMLIYEPCETQGWTFRDLKVNLPLEET